MDKAFPCIDTRPCFAKTKDRRCRILLPTGSFSHNYLYKRDGECPFCKPAKTKGTDK